MGELVPDANVCVYLQDRDFKLPDAFCALPGARVSMRPIPGPHRMVRLMNEWHTAFTARHDVLFFSGSSIAPLARSPMVSIVHADSRLQEASYGPLQARVQSAMIHMMRARASAVMVPTEAYADHLRTEWGLPASKLLAVHHGVDDVQAATEPVDLGPGRHLLAVTNAKSHKNVDTLVTAWLAISRRISNTHLWLVGRVDETAVLSSIKCVDPRFVPLVHFAGWLSHRDVMRHIAGSHVLVFPSEGETFGMPLAEAMMAGTPIVAADTAVSREVCADAALYAPARDPSALEAKIERVLTGTDTAALLRRRGLERATRFTWREAARLTLDLLKRVSAN